MAAPTQVVVKVEELAPEFDSDLATRLRAHAELHSDSKDLMLAAAARLDPSSGGI